MSGDALSRARERWGLNLTEHAWRRMGARGIAPEAVLAALQYGRAVQQDGAEVFFLGRKEVRRWAPLRDLGPYEGLHVVMGRDGTIITVYRNHRFAVRREG